MTALMIDTIKIRSPTMLRRDPALQAVQKKNDTRVQRWQQRLSLKTGKGLSGSRVVHPFTGMVDRFEKLQWSQVGCKSSPNHHRQLSETLENGQERVVPKCAQHQLSKNSAKKYRKSQRGAFTVALFT